MRALILAVFLPLSCFAQDLPFFAMDNGTGNGPYDPNTIAPLNFWWVASDISSNTPVTVWLDRTNKFPLVQTNAFNMPTNSSDGLTFDGTGYMAMSNSLVLLSNSTVVVICNHSPMGHIGTVISDTNLYTNIRMDQTNSFTFGYGNNYILNRTAGMNPTNLLCVGFTTAQSGGNLKLVGYTNGVQTASNTVGPLSSSQLDAVGSYGRQDGKIYGRIDMSYFGKIKEILIWTNTTLTAANMAYINSYANWKYPSGGVNPFFNVDNGYLFTWMRADNMFAGANTAPPTNGIRLYNLSSSPNYDANAVSYFETGGANIGPTWYNNLGPGGKPAFNTGEDASGGSHSTTYHTATTRNQPNYYFMVVQYTNGAAQGDLLDETYAGNRQQHMFIPGSSVLSVYCGVGGGNNYTYPWSITNWTILCSGVNGTSSFIRTNGVLLAASTSTVGANPMVQENIGDYGLGGYWWKGYIAEYLSYSGVGFSTNDLQNVENYLMMKYGFTNICGQPINSAPALWTSPILQQQTNTDDYANFTASSYNHQYIHNTSSSTHYVKKLRYNVAEVGGAICNAYMFVTTNVLDKLPQIGSYSSTNTIAASSGATIYDFTFTDANAPAIPPNTDFYINIAFTTSGGGTLSVQRKTGNPYQTTTYNTSNSTDTTPTAVDAWFEVYVCGNGL